MFPRGFTPQQVTTSFLTMAADGDYTILSTDPSRGRKFTCSSTTGDLVTLLGGGVNNQTMIGESHNFSISASGMFGPRDDTGDGWLKVTIEGAQERYYYMASGSAGVAPKAADFTLQGVFDYTTGQFAINDSVINNTNASSDIALLVGQTAYVDVSAATSAALHIATGDNQLYELMLALQGNGAATTTTYLQPNNTTYTNFFDVQDVSVSGTVGGAGNFASAFALGVTLGDIRHGRFLASTKTVSKNIHGTAAGFVNSAAIYYESLVCTWQATASSSGAGDTTTAWTSLGTIAFPVAATGRIWVRRLA